MTLVSRFCQFRKRSGTSNYNEKSPAKKIMNSEFFGLNLSIKSRICPESALDRTFTTALVIAPSIIQRSPRSVHIDNFAAKKEGYYSPGLLVHHVQSGAYLINWTVSYSIVGREETQQNQEIEYRVHTLRLRAEQKHSLQLDPSFVPTPIVNHRLSQSFHVSSDTSVK